MWVRQSCRWRCVWNSPPFSLPTPPRPSPNSARPCTSMASPCATPPRPKPKAKANNNRHQYFQSAIALPALFAADKISDLEAANALMEKPPAPANQHEIHRKQALAEKRSVLRPAPKCPWWPCVGSQQTRVRVGDAAVKCRSAPDANPLTPRHALKQSAAAGATATSASCNRAPNPKIKPLVLLHGPPF